MKRVETKPWFEKKIKEEASVLLILSVEKLEKCIKCKTSVEKINCTITFKYIQIPRTNVSQDVQPRFPVQLAFAKFLSRIEGNF